MKSLLQPVADEDKRVSLLVQNGKLKDIISVKLSDLNLPPQASTQRVIKLEKQMFQAEIDEDKKIKELLAQLERERLIKLAERELETKAILKKIDEAPDAEEKRRQIEQFERLKIAQAQQLERETQLAHGRLREALAARRVR